MKSLVLLVVTLFIVENVLSQIQVNSPKDLPRCKRGQQAILTADCSPCPLNMYKKKADRKGCKACPDGTGTLSTGSMNKKKDCIKFCKLGKYYDREIGDCVKCPVGRYMDERGLASDCKKCPGEMNTKALGASSISNCELSCGPGQQPKADGTSCEDCPDGFYKSSVKKENCEPCPVANGVDGSTLEDGATEKSSCTKRCEPGSEFNEGSGKCEKCAPGFYKKGNLTSSRDRCLPCGPNTLAKKSGQAECTVECGAGYQANGKGGCDLCPWGSYKSKVGEANCTLCGSSKVTLTMGTTEKACVKIKDPNFHDALPDLNAYIQMVQDAEFDEDSTIISALVQSCNSVDVRQQYLIQQVIQHFATIPDMDQLMFPPITIGTHTYGHEDQKKMLLALVNNFKMTQGEYCDYLSCVEVHGDEIRKAKAKMMYEASDPLPFCSEPMREVASSVTLNLLNCPLLEYDPELTEGLDMSGLTVQDILDTRNVVKLCSSEDEGPVESTSTRRTTTMSSMTTSSSRPTTDSTRPTPTTTTTRPTTNSTPSPTRPPTTSGKPTTTTTRPITTTTTRRTTTPGKTTPPTTSTSTEKMTPTTTTTEKMTPTPSTTTTEKMTPTPTTTTTEKMTPTPTTTTTQKITTPPMSTTTKKTSTPPTTTTTTQRTTTTPKTTTTTTPTTTTPLLCGLGSQPNADNTQCEPCGDGLYKGEIGAECVSCPEARPTTLTDGSSSIQECYKRCDAGMELNITSGNCIKCVKGYYKSEPGSRTRCLPCAPNYVSKKGGATECEAECGPGFQYNAQTLGCDECPWGAYKSKKGNDGTCSTCRKITLARGMISKENCTGTDGCLNKNAVADLNKFIEQMKKLKSEEDIYSALFTTCGSGNDETKAIVTTFINHFADCLAIREKIVLPTLTFGSATYSREFQMDLLNFFFGATDYCDVIPTTTTTTTTIPTTKTTTTQPTTTSQRTTTTTRQTTTPLSSTARPTTTTTTQSTTTTTRPTTTTTRPTTTTTTRPTSTSRSTTSPTRTTSPPFSVPYSHCQLLLNQTMAQLMQAAIMPNLCEIKGRLHEALKCFQTFGHSEMFLGQYFHIIESYLPYPVPDNTIQSIRNTLDEMCNEDEPVTTTTTRRSKTPPNTTTTTTRSTTTTTPPTTRPVPYQTCVDQLTSVLPYLTSSVHRCSIQARFNTVLDCFASNGYEETFINQYYGEIVGHLSLLSLPQRTIQGFKDLMKELCNPVPTTTTTRRTTTTTRSTTTTTPPTTTQAIGGPGNTNPLFDECLPGFISIIQPLIDNPLDFDGICPNMGNLEEAKNCFISDGIESTLMEYLANQPYMQVIRQMLNTVGITITSDFSGFDIMMDGMTAYCNNLNAANQLFAECLTPFNNVLTSGMIDLTSLATLDICNADIITKVQESAKCFTDNEITEQFLDYLKTDSSMKVFYDVLKQLRVSMDSLDTMMAALNGYCEASTAANQLFAKCLTPLNDALTSGMIDLTSLATLGICNADIMTKLQESANCFTDNEITDQFMNYLKTDSSMKVFYDALKQFSVSMDSLDTMMAALDAYCGASTGPIVNQFDECLADFTDVFSSVDLTSITMQTLLSLCDTKMLNSITGAIDCFVDNGMESDFLAYLTSDPSMSSLLNTQINVDSANALTSMLSNYCAQLSGFGYFGKK